jgi:hypothetical protein
MKKMIPITIIPGANAFIARVRSPPNAVAPTTPPPSATQTRLTHKTDTRVHALSRDALPRRA